MRTQQEIRHISKRLTAQGFMRQLHRKRYRIVSWRPDEMFPSQVPTSLAEKRACLRDLGLNPKTDVPALDQALALLPEAPPMAELSRRDAEGHKRRLSTAELCACKRSGILPVTKAKLNETVKALAKLDRPAAAAILARFGVLTTASLKEEDIAATHAAFVEALKKMNARAKP
jgi:hypothetical protein